MINTSMKISPQTNHKKQNIRRNIAGTSQVSFTGTPVNGETSFFYSIAEKVGKLCKDPVKVFKHFDFNGLNMTYEVVAFFIFGIVLGARLYQGQRQG